MGFVNSVNNTASGVNGQASSLAGGPTGQVTGAMGAQVAGAANPFVNAIAPQMQFNAQAPQIQQQNLMPYIGQGQQNIQQLNGQQQSLAQTLLQQSQGAGPNLSQLQLNQALDQASRQSSGVIAGQKGISTGTAQRLAAQNQAAASQGAAQQSAVTRAQQQLGSQGQLGGLYGQMSGQQLQNQGILQQAQAAQNNALVSSQLGAQEINARGAEANLRSRSGVLGGLFQGAGAVAGMSEGGKISGKAKLEGDHEVNDTVPAMLSPGEIVVPRSHAHSAEAAKEFIDQLMVKEHGDHYEVKDKDKEYKVAKKGLSPNLDKKMKKMADGGVAEEPMPDTSETVQIPQSAQEVAPQEQPSPNMIPQSNSSVEDMPAAKPTGQSVYAAKQPQNNQYLKFPQPDEYEKNISLQKQGVQESANAQSMGAQQQAKAYEEQQKHLTDTMNDFKARREMLDAEHKQLSDDIASSTIDPNKVWHDKSTGQKMAAGIGIVLAGIGSGLTGQPNAALQMIQNLQQRDLEAQRANLGKKQSLLSDNMSKYHNLEMATNATILQQNAITQGLISKAAANTNNAMAQAQAKIMMANIENDSIPRRYDLALKSQLMQQSGNNSEDANAARVRVFVPQAEQPKVFDALNKVNSNIDLQKRALSAFDKAAEEYQGLGRINPQAHKRVAAMVDPLVAAMEKGEAGKFSELGYNIFRQLMPSATDDEKTLKTNREALSELIASGKKDHESMLRGYGIKPSSLYGDNGQKAINEMPAR